MAGPHCAAYVLDGQSWQLSLQGFASVEYIAVSANFFRFVGEHGVTFVCSLIRYIWCCAGKQVAAQLMQLSM